MAITGITCELNRNTGTYDIPVWDAIPLIRDVTLNLEKGEADVTTRGANGWRQRIGTLKDASLDVELVWEQGDADFEAIRDSFLNNSLLDLAVMDGAIDEAGSQGLRSEMEVFSFNRAEPLDGAVMANASIKPAFSTNAPSWLVVSV